MGYINMYSMGAGLAAILAVSYQFGLVHLTNMTSVLVYLGVTMVGFILGFVMVMFSGKKRKQSMIANPSPAANVLVMKVMVRLDSVNKIEIKLLFNSENFPYPIFHSFLQKGNNLCRY